MAGAGEQPTTKAELLSVVQDLIFRTNQGNGKNNFIQTNDSLWTIFTYLIDFFDDSISDNVLTVTSYPTAQPVSGEDIGDLYIGATTTYVWSGSSWVVLSAANTFAVGTSGTDFNVTSVAGLNTYNLPTASATNRGALSTTDWSTFNSKQAAITLGTTAQYFRGDLSLATFPTNVSSFTNDSGYITAAGVPAYTGSNGITLVTYDFRIDYTRTGNVYTGNGLVNSPLFHFNGVPYTGGTSTTTKPFILLEPTGTTSTNWGTSGTMFGINAASGFAGNLLDIKLNNTSYFINNSTYTQIAISLWLTGGSSQPSIWANPGANFTIGIGANYAGGGATSRIIFDGDISFKHAASVTNLYMSANGTMYMPTNGVVSYSGFSSTGTWYSGGSATTTKPMWLLEPTGTTSTSWSTSGTGFGINSASGFTGNIFDFKANNTTYLKLTAAGVLQDNTGLFTINSGNGVFANLTVGNTGYYSWASSTILTAATNSTLLLTNAAANDFGRIMLGGTTSSFPSVGRNGNNITIKLADNSAFAPIEALRYLTTTNAVVSFPQFYGSGTWYSGGTSTTTKPYLLLEPTGTTSTNWSTSGTGIGVNAASGFVGDLLKLQTNNASSLRVDYLGNIYIGLGGTGTREITYNGYGMTIGQSSNSKIIFYTAVGQVVQFTAGGNILLGQSGTDLGHRLQITGATQTGSSTEGLINASQTWNTTGIVTAFLQNITNTASNAASLLLDLQVSSVSKLSIGLIGNITNTGNNIVSTSLILSNGTWYSGGTTTTTKPMWLIEPTGTTSTTWNVNGTGLGINAATDFTGNLFDFKLANALRLSLGYNGMLTGVDALFTGNVTVVDDAYAAGWNGSAYVPTKNAIYDKIESLSTSGILSGTHRNLSISFVAPLSTPTAGTDNTAMTVKSITLPANTCVRLGDRLRITAIIDGTDGGAIQGVLKLNGVTLSSGYVNTTGSEIKLEAYVDYVDSTHATIQDMIAGTITVESAGFDWTAGQAVLISQEAIGSQHINVYSLIVDFMPITV